MSDLLTLSGSLGFDIEASGEGEIELKLKTTMNDTVRDIVVDQLGVDETELNKRYIGKVSGSIEVSDDPRTLKALGLCFEIMGKIQQLATLDVPDELVKTTFNKDRLSIVEDLDEE